MIDSATCNEPSLYNHLVTVSMICAGATGIDACEGDSGGPMVAISGNHFELAGVSSWGFGCAVHPGVYANAFGNYYWVNYLF